MLIRVVRNLKKKKKDEGKIVESINEKDFIDFKKFMTNKKIDLPTYIDEFYVDNDNDDEDNYSNNEEEFDKIFQKIKKTTQMIKSVNKIEYDKI